MLHFLVDWDFARAAEEFRLGMERKPTALAQGLSSWFSWAMGRWDEAIAAATRLIDLEPTTAQWRSDVGWDHWSAGRLDTARAFAARAIALDSAFYEPYHMLAWIEATEGNIPAARRALARARELAGGDFWLRQTAEGFILARSGDLAGARQVLRAMEGDPRLAQRAILLHAVGDVGGMYAMFGRAIEARDPDTMWILNSFPVLRPLRREPRYQQLLDRMGMPKEWRG
jgi:tetratricopeptide (TPR) repeat protein